MYKQILKVLIVLILIYLGFAFVLWEFNPGLWEDDARTGCVTTFLVWLLFFASSNKK